MELGWNACKGGLMLGLCGFVVVAVGRRALSMKPSRELTPSVCHPTDSFPIPPFAMAYASCHAITS